MLMAHWSCSSVATWPGTTYTSLVWRGLLRHRLEHTHTHTYMLLAVSLIHSRIAGNTHTLQAGMHTLRKVTHISCSTQALQVPRTHCRDHAYIAGAMHALQAGMHTLREVTHIAGTRHAYHGPAWYTLQAVIHTLQAVRNIWQEVIHFAGTTRKLITGISLF